MINNKYAVSKDSMHSVHFLTIHVSFQQIRVQYLLCALHILEDKKKNKSYDLPKEPAVFSWRENIYRKYLVMIKGIQLVITAIYLPTQLFLLCMLRNSLGIDISEFMNSTHKSESIANHFLNEI